MFSSSLFVICASPRARSLLQRPRPGRQGHVLPDRGLSLRSRAPAVQCAFDQHVCPVSRHSQQSVRATSRTGGVRGDGGLSFPGHGGRRHGALRHWLRGRQVVPISQLRLLRPPQVMDPSRAVAVCYPSWSVCGLAQRKWPGMDLARRKLVRGEFAASLDRVCHGLPGFRSLRTWRCSRPHSVSSPSTRAAWAHFL